MQDANKYQFNSEKSQLRTTVRGRVRARRTLPMSKKYKLKSRYVVLLEKVTEDPQKTQINNPRADQNHEEGALS
jgi:endonuclease I